MGSIRTAGPCTRFAWAALLALLLTVRVVGSVGYMPTVEHGRLTVMLCPDGEWTAPAFAMHRMGGQHPSNTSHHQQCPYAAAAAIPFAAGDAPALLSPLALPFVLAVAGALPSLSLRARFERPFSTGPPIPA